MPGPVRIGKKPRQQMKVKTRALWVVVEERNSPKKRKMKASGQKKNATLDKKNLTGEHHGATSVKGNKDRRNGGLKKSSNEGGGGKAKKRKTE